MFKFIQVINPKIPKFPFYLLRVFMNHQQILMMVVLVTDNFVLSLQSFYSLDKR